MKKILIIEDNYVKFEKTKKYIQKTFPDCDINYATYAKGGVIELKKAKESGELYDYVIVDMYMPINSDSRIDSEGGFYVLNKIKHRNLIDLSKVVINSSEKTLRKTMDEKGYEKVDFIYHDPYASDLVKEFYVFFNK
jgi:CheY-like chemotaxis protein